MEICNVILNGDKQTMETPTMENVIEVKTKETRDSWGNKGVCTYKRISDWFDNGGDWTESWATVYVSDTSTGHGWGGQMNKTRWEMI